MRIRSKSVLSDAETTFCGVDDARVFQYSIQGVLQARKVSQKHEPNPIIHFKLRKSKLKNILNYVVDGRPDQVTQSFGKISICMVR